MLTLPFFIQKFRHGLRSKSARFGKVGFDRSPADRSQVAEVKNDRSQAIRLELIEPRAGAACVESLRDEYLQRTTKVEVWAL
jgi:hypothetical protein